jgi:hypothetical protein
MRLILHIGMGKTGTSSIQSTLQNQGQALAQQKASYLGMWFSALDEKYHGYQGQIAFFQTPPEEQAELAHRFCEILHQKAANDGIETFIFSNEEMFSSVELVKVFLDTLRESLDLSLLAYIRDPHDWLPSAYNQWSLLHKNYTGPMRSFSEFAPEVIGQYHAFRIWKENFGDNLTVRLHEKSTDVVQDFATTCGLQLQSPAVRRLERAEPAEMFLRAAFNARFDDNVLPERFNQSVQNKHRRAVPTFTEMANLCFRYDGIDAIVDDHKDLFHFIRDQFGFDFSGTQSAAQEMPDDQELQRRLIDYLIEITLDQSVRIRHLEHKQAQRDAGQ